MKVLNQSRILLTVLNIVAVFVLGLAAVDPAAVQPAPPNELVITSAVPEDLNQGDTWTRSQQFRSALPDSPIVLHGTNIDGISVYASRSEFTAATGNQSIIDFEGIAPPGAAVPFPGTSGITLQEVKFVGTAAWGCCGELYVVSDSHGVGGVRDWGTGDSLGGDRFGYFQISGTPRGNIQAFLPANTYAVGMDFMLVYTNGAKPAETVLFNVWTGDTVSNFYLNSVANGPAFAGFISTAPITSIQYRTLGVGGENSAYGNLDNFTVASSQPSGGDTTPPTVTVPASFAVDATTPAGAIVTYTATALDAVDGSRPVNCSSSSGSRLPIGTTTVSCQASDLSGNTATGSFEVTVRSAIAQISNLATSLAGIDGVSFSLQLNNVQHALSAGQKSAACGSLNAFANHVKAQAGKQLTAATATQLLEDVRRIATVMGC